MPTIQEIRQQYPQYSDMTDQQLSDSLHSKYYSDIPKDEYYGRIGFIPPLERKEMDFFQRVGEDFSRRQQIVQEKKREFKRGEFPATLVGTKAATQAAALATDIVGEGMVSAFRALPDVIEEPIRETGADVLESPVGQVGIQAMQAGGEIWGGFKKQNPEVASLTEDAANVLGLYYMLNPKTAVKHGAKATGKTIKAATAPPRAAFHGTKQVIKGLAARSADDLDTAALQIKKLGSDFYNRSKEMGAVINRKKTANIINRMNTAMKKKGKLHPRLHGDTMTIMDDLRAVQKSGPLGLDDLDQHRSLLRAVIDKNTDPIKGMNPDALMAQQAINAMDDSIAGLKKIDVIGGNTEAIDLLLSGRNEWKRFRKFEQITHMVKRAGGDPNKIRSEFKRFSMKPKNLRGFSEQERAMIKAIGNPGASDKILKGIGRFGFEPQNVFLPMVGGYVVGGPTGAALLSAGTVARQARRLATRAEPEQLLKAIESAPLK